MSGVGGHCLRTSVVAIQADICFQLLNGPRTRSTSLKVTAHRIGTAENPLMFEAVLKYALMKSWSLSSVSSSVASVDCESCMPFYFSSCTLTEWTAFFHISKAWKQSSSACTSANGMTTLSFDPPYAMTPTSEIEMKRPDLI